MICLDFKTTLTNWRKKICYSIVITCLFTYILNKIMESYMLQFKEVELPLFYVFLGKMITEQLKIYFPGIKILEICGNFNQTCFSLKQKRKGYK